MARRQLLYSPPTSCLALSTFIGVSSTLYSEKFDGRILHGLLRTHVYFAVSRYEFLKFVVLVALS